ncbi:VanZ family protein [Photobacterium aphoticum]|uniref:VanZ-like domain-containing protein n=1 Tax=Photobacterium aphoticum TaxID=754436 RepID=A0A0J1GMM9_9GAMM|nr:VanZ family protein [Photobacterium aphoticum]KLV01015.1 hypothetical protein ABT58_09390 [Photobacterium aphoticum]PSU58429.1 VanZ family protein [Photobacterium aphoticum]GHA37201.1 hypothetical protein GCM10007086_08060 [Photobacterium aphoticum]
MMSYSNKLPHTLKSLSCWLVFIAYSGWIGFISLSHAAQPGDLTDLNQYGIMALDKFLHFGAYGLFVYLGYYTVSATHFRLCCIMIAGYGFGLEMMQGNVPGREAALDDGIANLMGVIVGYYAMKWLTGLKHQRSHRREN